MKPPCEIVVWYVIPAIRSELAKELLNLGMRQKDVSELMDITQPAVSQYITDKRGSGIKLDDNVRQMIKDFIVAQKAINRLNGISDMQDPAFVEMALKYQPGDDIYNMLSQISKGEIDEVTLTQLPYLYERVNVYMWILGLASKPRQDKQCDYVFTGYTLYKYNNIDEILNNCKMKSYDEIMEFADLITRYEWAMIELSQNGQTSKKINNDSVIEQKKAMDFVTSFDSNILLKNNN